MGFLSDFGGGALNTVQGGWDILTGQGEQKAKNKEVRTAAQRDREQKKVFDDWFASMYGQPEDKFDADYYLKNNKDVAEKYGIDINNITEKDKKKAKKHYDKFGMAEGREAYDLSTEFTPYKERLSGDIAYKQGNDQRLLRSFLNTNNRIRENNQGTYGNLSALVDAYKGRALSAPMQISGAGFTGAPMEITTRTAQDARNYITDQFGALNRLANETANLNLQGSQAVNQYRNAYTPNRVENEYANYLQSLKDRDDSLRYGIPTTSSTGSYDAPTNILAGLGSAAKIFSQFIPFAPGDQSAASPAGGGGGGMANGFSQGAFSLGG